MKMLNVALIAGAIATGAAAPAWANNTTDSQSYADRMESLWVLTGDPTYARLLRQAEQPYAGSMQDGYAPGY